MSEDLMEDLAACMDAGIYDEEDLPGDLGALAAAFRPTGTKQQRSNKAARKETKKTAASTKKNPVSAEKQKSQPSSSL